MEVLIFSVVSLIFGVGAVYLVIEKQLKRGRDE